MLQAVASTLATKTRSASRKIRVGVSLSSRRVAGDIAMRELSLLSRGSRTHDFHLRGTFNITAWNMDREDLATHLSGCTWCNLLKTSDL